MCSSSDCYSGTLTTLVESFERSVQLAQNELTVPKIVITNTLTGYSQSTFGRIIGNTSQSVTVSGGLLLKDDILATVLGGPP